MMVSSAPDPRRSRRRREPRGEGWESLNDTFWLSVLQYLDCARDLLSLGLVSRRFRRLASAPEPWRALCLRLHPEWARAQIAALDTRTFNWKLAYARRIKLAARDGRPPAASASPATAGMLQPSAASAWDESAASVLPTPEAVSHRRALCSRCQRPPGACFCASLPPIGHPLLDNSGCRVVILQDTKTQVSIGTVQLLRLALTHCTVFIDRDFSPGRYPELDAILDRGDAYLLFPALSARTVLETFASKSQGAPSSSSSSSSSSSQPMTLIAIDGSWRTAKAIHRWNPRIALNTIPVQITSTTPSVFGAIKREPKEHFLSTMEAVAKAVGGLLHGDEDLILPLLLPSLEHIVRTQQEYNERFTAMRLAAPDRSDDDHSDDDNRPKHTAERSLPIHGRPTKGKPWRRKKAASAPDDTGDSPN